MGYNHKYIENLKIKVINSILTPKRNPNNDKLNIFWKLPETDINNLQFEVFREQTLNLSTHLAVFELLAYYLSPTCN